MTEPLFVDGRPVRLGRRLGRGGEGTIFAIDGNDGLVAKIYHQPDAARAAKVAAMIEAGLARRAPFAAFPIAALRDRREVVVGFTMRAFVGWHPIHELFTPISRRKVFPNGDHRFLLTVALNLAGAVTEVHRLALVIGDINHSSILVASDGQVALIDADSMAIGEHRCRVGIAEYTAPELQGISLAEVDRTPAHDGFGLAVLIWQLLALGRHPFASVGSDTMTTLAESIGKGRFAHTVLTRRRARPPPASVIPADLTFGLRVLFERALGRDPRLRPQTHDWVEALGLYEQKLRSCSVDKRHQFGALSDSCPWCRIEGQTRKTLFGEVRDRRRNPTQRLRLDLLRSAAEARAVIARLEPPGSLSPPRSASPAAIARAIREPSLRTRPYPDRDEAVVAVYRAQAPLNKAMVAWRETVRVPRVEAYAAAIEQHCAEARWARMVGSVDTKAHQAFAAALTDWVANQSINTIARLPPTLAKRLADAGIATLEQLAPSSLDAVEGLASAVRQRLVLEAMSQIAAFERDYVVRAIAADARAFIGRDNATVQVSEALGRGKALREGLADQLKRTLKLASLPDGSIEQLRRDHQQAVVDTQYLGLTSSHPPIKKTKRPLKIPKSRSTKSRRRQ